MAKKHPTSINIDSSLWKKAKIEAIKHNMTITDLLEGALRNELNLLESEKIDYPISTSMKEENSRKKLQGSKSSLRPSLVMNSKQKTLSPAQIAASMPSPAQIAASMPSPAQIAASMPSPAQIAASMPSPAQIAASINPATFSGITAASNLKETFERIRNQMTSAISGTTMLKVNSNDTTKHKKN